MAKVDWRSRCPPIRNQGVCGSCTAFATIGSWESLFIIERNENVDLSEQNLFMCSGGSCNTGNFMPNVLNQALKAVPTLLVIRNAKIDVKIGGRQGKNLNLGNASSLLNR